MTLRLVLLVFVAVAASVTNASAGEQRPSLHVSCPKKITSHAEQPATSLECFEDYLRQELNYFEFVRDRFLSDADLVITRQAAGSGGERFTVQLMWSIAARKRFHIEREVYQDAALVPPGATTEAARASLAQSVLRVLLESLKSSSHRFAFELNVPKRTNESLSQLPDAWNYVVIAPELLFGGEGGSGYYYLDGAAALTVRRTTEPWRLRFRGSYERDWNGFQLEDGSRVSADLHTYNARVLSAHALGRHWALGGIVSFMRSDYENYEVHLRGGPAVEFNLFPYTDNASRQLRFVYQAGAWYNRYMEPSRDNLLQELKPYHALSFISDVHQPWGSVQWIVQANQFLDELDAWRLATGATLGFRLTAGLSFVLEANYAYVEDLINVRGRPVTDEELLLWKVQQPTSFTFWGKTGFVYTFGSRHNNLVNPRFGRVDLDEE